MGQKLTYSSGKKRKVSRRKRSKTSVSRDIAHIARHIKLTRIKNRDIFTPSGKMLAATNLREDRLTGDGVVITGRKKSFRWPPVANQNPLKSAKPIKNWTATNKVGDQETIPRLVPEIAIIFKEKRPKVKSREASKIGSRDKKRRPDSKKGIIKKKPFKPKNQSRPASPEKHGDPEKIIYNEEDRQMRLKRPYFVKSNELPYQNAAGFAKLMKELKDRFNSRPPDENGGEIIDKNISQGAKDKIDNARKKLYNILDRKTETKIQNVSKQRVRIYSSCEIREKTDPLVEKISPVAKSTSNFEDKTSQERKIKSIFNPEFNKTQISKEDLQETDKKSNSARTRFRTKIKNFEIPTTPPNPKSRESPKSKTPEKRFRSSNGNSRIYFYKKPIPTSFLENGSPLSNSLDPNQFRGFINKFDRSFCQNSSDNLMIFNCPGVKKKNQWVLDENRSWKKVIA